MKLIISILTFISSYCSWGRYQLEDIIYKQVTEQGYAEDVSKHGPSSEYISQEKLEQNLATSVDDVLRLTPGASTARGPRSSSEVPQIRGLDARKISVTVDGMKQNYREGHSFMTPVDVDNLKTVTIQKSNTDLSETGTIGGTIEFTTKDPEDFIPNGKSSTSHYKMQYHSAANEKVVAAKTAFKNKKLKTSGLISISNNNANNLRLNNKQELRNSAYEDTNLLTKMTYKNIKLKLEHFERKDNNPLNPGLDPPAQFTRSLSDTLTTRNAINLSFKNKAQLKAQAYVIDFQTKKKPRDLSAVQERTLTTTGARLQKDFKFISLGAQTYADNLSSRKENNPINSYPEAEGTHNSAFISGHYKIGRTTILPGMRLDNYTLKAAIDDFETKRGDALSRKLQVNYQCSESFQSKLAYSEGFHAPHVSEVFPTGLHNPGDGFFFADNYFISNTELTHEQSQMREIEFVYARQLFSNQDQLKIMSSYYENDIQNYINLERIDRSVFDDQEGTTQFINTPEVKIYGYELATKYLHQLFEVDLIYTQVRGRNITQTLFLEDMPADFYTFNLVTFLDKYQLELGYTITHTLTQPRVNPETIQRTVETPAYTIQDAFVRKRFKNIELSYKINNIGNREYRRHASHLFESAEDHRFAFKYQITHN